MNYPKKATKIAKIFSFFNLSKKPFHNYKVVLAILLLFVITSFAAIEAYAASVGVISANFQAVRGIRTGSYFENANAPSTNSPITVNTGTSNPTTPILDGSVSTGFNASSGSVSLTTTSTSDIIYVVAAVKSSTITVNTPTATGLTFTLRGSASNAGNGKVWAWYAVSGSTFSGSISATLSGSATFTLTVFGIKGANTASPFDSGVSSPVTATGTSTSATVTMNPSGTNDFIIGAAYINNNPTVNVGSGFALIANAKNGAIQGASEYKNRATSGSQSVSLTLSTSQAWAIIGDAIVPSSGSFTIAKGTSAYLWTNQFSTATSIPTGKMTLDLWATPTSTTPSLDGSVSTARNSNTGSVTLTTTNAYDIIYVVVAVKGASTITVTAPTATGLTFTSRGAINNAENGKVWAWYAVSSSTFSGAISVTASTSTRFVLTAFGVSGANSATPFDSSLISNGTTLTGTSTSALVTVNPSSSNDFIIGAAYVNNNPTVTVGSGFTSIFNTASGTMQGASEYKNSAASGSQTVSFALSTSQAWAMIGDAITPANTVSVSASAIGSSPSLDGSNSIGFSASSGSVSLSTTSTNDVIYVVAAVKGASTINVATPTATGLTFTSRVNITNGNNGKVSAWYAVSSSPAFSGSISVTLSSSATFTLTAFGIKGANTASPFGIASPVTATGSGKTASFTVNPSGANNFIIGAAYINNNPTVSVGSGYTLIANTASAAMQGASEYKNGAASGSQTVSFSWTPANQNWAMIGDAIASSSPTVFFSNQPSNALPAGGGQVATTFNVTAGTIPASGYIQIVITAPATTGVTVYWGSGKPTNVQLCFTYS